MKPLRLLLVLLLFVAAARTAQAQDAPAQDVADAAPPGIVLLKLKWSREVEFARGREQSPFDASVSQLPSSPMQNRAREIAEQSRQYQRVSRLRYVYHYTAKIRNDGAKEIRGLVWDYVVSDPASQRVLGRHRFHTREKIGGQERATLRGRSPVAPARVVTAQGLEKDKRSPFEERFEIRCVVYADGSWWTHPSPGRFDCHGLKGGEKDRRAESRKTASTR